MVLIIIFSALTSLILLITIGKVNAFLSFLIISIVTGLFLGIPLENITASIQKGIGDTMGSIIIIIALGAMLGKLIAATGAAQKIAEVLMKVFGQKYITWALALSGLIVGIPLFYGVGFVLMVPLIFSIVYQYKLPAVATGLPMIAALSVTHGFLPPHPSPTALVQQFHASMGLTLMYGLMIGIPAIIVAGPLFSSTLKSIKSRPLEMFQVQWIALKDLPGTAKSFLTALLPILLFTLTTFIPLILPTAALKSFFHFLGEGSIVMLISIIIATFTLGKGTGKSISEVMNMSVMQDIKTSVCENDFFTGLPPIHEFQFQRFFIINLLFYGYFQLHTCFSFDK